MDWLTIDLLQSIALLCYGVALISLQWRFRVHEHSYEEEEGFHDINYREI